MNPAFVSLSLQRERPASAAASHSCQEGQEAQSLCVTFGERKSRFQDKKVEKKTPTVCFNQGLTVELSPPVYGPCFPLEGKRHGRIKEILTRKILGWIRPTR